MKVEESILMGFLAEADFRLLPVVSAVRFRFAGGEGAGVVMPWRLDD